MHSVFTNANIIANQIYKAHENFLEEVKDYLTKYPNTQHIDIYLNDINGAIRGKRISVESLFSLNQGCYFPLSVYSMDMHGRVLEHDQHDGSSDEPDRLCLPVKGTLRPCARDPQHHAQLLLTMMNPDSSSCILEPRTILENVLSKLHQKGLYPVVAAEIEFYLTSNHTSDEGSSGCFQLDASSRHTRFIDDIEALAHEQYLPLTGIVAEAEANQFELNLRHSDKVVEACENVLAIKRMTRLVAEKHGYNANFMAKPFAHLAGSGLHFHISLCNSRGDNIFRSPSEKPNCIMRRCLAGMLSLMPASIAIVAPNVNSYRRLRKSLDEPLFGSWGYNNRSAALRIPCSDDNNRRIEYRLAGADANPYLVMATILTGMLYGLEKSHEHSLPPACAESSDIPLFQQLAIENFRQCDYLTTSLGKEFSQIWISCKTSELANFESMVTPAEGAWRY